jgi:branched-chain amino acid transport system ATP-binding protein
MLAVARAIVSDPKILLVDEPSHGLGPQVVDDLFHLLDELRERGLGVLVVEQEAAPALRKADRVYVLTRGRVTNEGDAVSVLGDRSRLAKAYLG